MSYLFVSEQGASMGIRGGRIEVKCKDEILRSIPFETIINNKRRTKFAKAMEGYGMRVQKSCFEAYLTTALYDKIIKEIPDHIDLKEDSVRVYRMVGAGEVTLFGINVEPKAEDLIII